jgi:membrane protein required for colicin V production
MIMAIVDWVILIVLILSVLSAAKAGLVLEVCTLAGLVLGVLVASWDYQKLTPWMGQWIHSPALNEALSFMAITLGVMIAAGIVGRIIRWSVKSVGLGWADRLAGAAFGLLKGCALVTIAVMVIAAFWPTATWFQQSRFAPRFLSMAHAAAAVAPAALEYRIRSGVVVLRRAQPEWMRPAA